MHRLLAASLLLLFFLAAVAPIRNYDSFWNLATGRWIAEHHALPLTDPFAVASARIPWINGEWLYQLVLYAFWAAGGAIAACLSNMLLVAAIFTLGYVAAGKHCHRMLAVLLAAIAFSG